MTSVEIAYRPGDGGYRAVVDGRPLDIAAYVADPGDGGKVMVSLIVAADALQVGIPPRQLAPERRNQPPMTTWGNPDLPDPRANVPGWQPTPSAAEAGRAHTGEHRALGNGRPA
ncbi:hypothetical protein AMIS_20760 [Actinoplanes missouriensis 431]|uniref:Uncharacterized protein n=1 Tax=Actinoplanes missouriensis (strain ATCC 14538 / DSM 43046 / CBS 188.64 / JCM 3121 / NBRC 102363 / NCIMB 12654 / NRRL B-3342 / UNCC 431) TaxID=512565 RepID=I0H2Q9_ACTM4|nr:hypothetical protein [Actinoplanes missouriensis]BAL87296.1 hypothetical protein AMIS_20760 [Actinoplanes missouriensis 431]